MRFKKVLCIVMSFIICVSFTLGGKMGVSAETCSSDASNTSDDSVVSLDGQDNESDTYAFEDKTRGLTVTLNKTDEWEGGCIAEVTLKNNGLRHF